MFLYCYRRYPNVGLNHFLVPFYKREAAMHALRSLSMMLKPITGSAQVCSVVDGAGLPVRVDDHVIAALGGFAGLVDVSKDQGICQMAASQVLTYY
jgi:hypothetical protein